MPITPAPTPTPEPIRLNSTKEVVPITPAPTPTPDPIRLYNQEEVMPADDLDQTTLLETEEDLNQQVINGLLSIDS